VVGFSNLRNINPSSSRRNRRAKRLKTNIGQFSEAFHWASLNGSWILLIVYISVLRSLAAIASDFGDGYCSGMLDRVSTTVEVSCFLCREEGPGSKYTK
jgi:hypothetical protein